MIVDKPSDYASLTTLRLFPTDARTGVPVEVPITEDDGVWSADVTGVAAGRWHLQVLGGLTGGGNDTFDLPYVDLPVDDTLVISPETVAVAAKIPLPLTADQRETITEAILDAQSDVVAYLGRAILPELRTETDRWAYHPGGDWNLVALGDDPLIRVVEVVAQLDAEGDPTDYFTVTYLCGIDAREPEYRPIRRFIKAHVLYSPTMTTLWKAVVNPTGEVKTVSAEGQSITFQSATLSGNSTTGTKPGDGTPGSLPTLSSMDRWRVAGRRVHQGASKSSDWPYSGTRW